MKTKTKLNFFVSLFNGLLFGIVFTIAGGLIISGSVDWPNFLVTVLVGMLIGVIVGMILPLGKMGATLAGKFAKYGSIAYNFILNSVILLTMLLFMSPALTIFIGSILYGAPISAVLPNSYGLFIPFYFIGIVLMMILGNPIMNLAKSCTDITRN